MNFVRVSGRIGLTSLWISVSSYFLSLILYVISFCLSDWIIYKKVAIKIGLWRLCDINIIGYDYCFPWDHRIYPANITATAFNGPPDFIKTSQSLEIVAFVFYMIAAIFLLTGLTQRSMGLLFFASSISMFITVIFVSSTIALFSLQGKTFYNGSLSFAWWIALSALILSIINCFSSFILSFYIQPSTNFNQNKMMETNEKIFYSLPPYSTDPYVIQN